MVEDIKAWWKKLHDRNIDKFNYKKENQYGKIYMYIYIQQKEQSRWSTTIFFKLQRTVTDRKLI